MTDEFENERAEHTLISKALIEKNDNLLIDKYGSVENGKERLHQLEHLLNYGDLKHFK